jgi:hypothetical protein
MTEPSYHVYSDVAGSFGCGVFVQRLGWFQIQWPGDWRELDIAAKELVPVVVAAALWGPAWSGMHIQFHSDNMAVVNTRTAKTDASPFTVLSTESTYSIAHSWGS